MEKAVQQLFDQAHHIVFLTGAGVSTASGIPDFRSANGLYTKDKNAEYYLSHRYFAKDPDGFYQFCKDNLYFPDAKPNVIHTKQAALTQQDRATVITQNIDNLYEEAGTKHLIDFHGNLFNVYCEKCGQSVPVAEYLKSRIHQVDGGPLRPDIVLYDEGIKQENVIDSVRAMQAADLVVIVGTSMKVYPFAGLLEYANPAATILAINQEPLQLPVKFQMIQTDASKFFADLTV
ncbi:NAD-dependent deacetylase (regulatory protein SIR2 family protein) [Limosilactobacillus frumenti DSM 13145]|uniref:protein acetyllysine N-acetyltransferase n=1 Tax=Limosilactobacillus frumenti DSM 13145 TaxID=1423746 RepID=A0A0R1P8B1_9LACO|nr:NAD-dependent protein deacylase [Limosilactobacillus frumenti]KRL28718.1 NAD-dependent deacetylase (regulatory protein SIR2 family protein) [Limosilactobacillus frumenti DSM 13145]MBA2914583.1 NAD-dependent protein deacylase [Limosilactobacillus frumenti]QFG72060.1 NAD-dependent protein deacylase [Limosilactobacillus frumenti]